VPVLQTYLPAIFSLLGALVGASVSGWFAYRRFLSEKWWDRKYQAYAETLEALNSIRDDLETNFDFHITNREIDEDRQKELSHAYRDGRRNVEKQRAIGGLVLSDESVAVLKEFERSMSQASGATDYFSHLDASLAATKDAIGSIVAHGRRELKARGR
jgi:hypothetical protein